MRWSLTASAYTLGSVFGGMAIGSFMGATGQMAAAAIGEIPAGAALGVLAIACAVGIIVDNGGMRLPTWRRQVDETWLVIYRGWVYGFGFGFQLGLGVVTIVTSAIVYVALLAALLSGSWISGLAIGTTFGAVRAVPLLLTARIDTPGDLRNIHRWLAHRRGSIEHLTNAALVSGVVIALSAIAGIGS